MTKTRITKKLMTWMTMTAMGGTCFQLSGCDQAIRSQIITGLNSAADTLIISLTGALFTALDNAGQDDNLTGGTLTGSN